MTETASQEPVEFVQLGGHTVRVTSWRSEPDGSGYRLVTITRGTRDAGLLDEILARPAIDLAIAGQDDQTVAASELDRRSFGQGQSGITRFGVLLRILSTAEAATARDNPASLEDRVAHLEAEVRELRSLVDALRKDQPAR
jgi:hypothetical protein